LGKEEYSIVQTERKNNIEREQLVEKTLISNIARKETWGRKKGVLVHLVQETGLPRGAKGKGIRKRLKTILQGRNLKKTKTKIQMRGKTRKWYNWGGYNLEILAALLFRGFCRKFWLTK